MANVDDVSITIILRKCYEHVDDVSLHTCTYIHTQQIPCMSDFCGARFGLAQIHYCRMLLYGTGSTFAIIGFVLWPDLPTTQSLNHAFKTRPTVSDYRWCRAASYTPFSY